MSTTRYPGGISTSSNTQGTFGDLAMPDPTKFHNYFNDFDTYAAGDWTITEVGSGTRALTAVDGGNLLVTNAAADNDGNFFQLKVASFLFAASKQAFFRCRFKTSDATQSDLQFGLLATDTTPLDVTDGIYFQKDDGAATIDAYVRKDATTGSNKGTAIATLVSDTFITLGFAYDGRGNTKFFVNDVLTTTLDSSSTYFPDAICNLSFGLQNGEAVAKTMTLDYVFAAIER